MSSCESRESRGDAVSDEDVDPLFSLRENWCRSFDNVFILPCSRNLEDSRRGGKWPLVQNEGLEISTSAIVVKFRCDVQRLLLPGRGSSEGAATLGELKTRTERR